MYLQYGIPFSVLEKSLLAWKNNKSLIQNGREILIIVQIVNSWNYSTDNIVVLTEDNFESIITNNKYVFMWVHPPWDAYDVNDREAFARAATILSDQAQS